jgi:RimJ/RimL family protein N-acetyltransferase
LIEIVYGQPVAEFVGKHNGFLPSKQSQAIGLERDGVLVAGCLFEDWNGASFVCHLAIDGRAHRNFFWAVCRYAFTQSKARKLIAPVYSNNSRMVRMAMRMRFIPEGCIADAQPDGDILLFTLTPDRCRFLEDRWGR